MYICKYIYTLFKYRYIYKYMYKHVQYRYMQYIHTSFSAVPRVLHVFYENQRPRTVVFLRHTRARIYIHVHPSDAQLNWNWWTYSYVVFYTVDLSRRRGSLASRRRGPRYRRIVARIFPAPLSRTPREYRHRTTSNFTTSFSRSLICNCTQV